MAGKIEFAEGFRLGVIEETFLVHGSQLPLNNPVSRRMREKRGE
jgi:hypothetical protein